MESYPPLVAMAPRFAANQRSVSGVGGFHIMRCGIDPVNHRFCPRCVGVLLQMGGMIYDPKMGRYPLRVALAPRNPANQRIASV